jgi:hypothetical protein
MRLVHTTFRSNMDSIMAHGLMAGRGEMESKGRVWFHASYRNSWAEGHVRDRHDRPYDDLVHLTCHVPDSLLRAGSPGLYYICTDLMPGLICSGIVVKRVSEVLYIL